MSSAHVDRAGDERAPAARSVPSGRRVDAGYTLMEVAITIALLGLIVIPIIDAVRTAVQVSHTNRVIAQVESALVNAADRVNRAPQVCDYTEYAQAAVQTQGWAATQASVDTVMYDPIAAAWSPTGDGCRFDSPTADLVQRVTITITSPDGTTSRSIQVVKSRV